MKAIKQDITAAIRDIIERRERLLAEHERVSRRIAAVVRETT
jgi:hypothetical protein